jgi:hypothetical protein
VRLIYKFVASSLPLLLIGTSACADIESPSAPTEVSRFSAEGDPTVSWVNDTLTFTFEGETFRLVRDQASATEVSVFHQDTAVGSYDLSWSGSSVVSVRASYGSDWFDSDTEGEIFDSSAGWDPCECPPWPETCEFCQSSFMSGPDCTQERQAAISAGNEAVGIGLMAVATSTTPVSVPVAAVFVWKTGAYFGKLLDYVYCRAGWSSMAVASPGRIGLRANAVALDVRLLPLSTNLVGCSPSLT